MKSPSESFESFISELSASLKGESEQAALNRINTERLLILTLEEIVEQRPDMQIHVLADNRIVGQEGADILMQIDDYEIRLVLISAPSSVPALELEQLTLFRDTFEENPSTEYIVLIWTTEDLKSQKLNLQIIDYLKKHPDKISLFLKKVKPLKHVIDEILTSHLKMWDAVLLPSKTDTSSISDVRNLFLSHIQTAMHDVRDRSYRNVERKMAAAKMPQNREVSVLSNVLDEALQGLPSKNLAERLAQLPK